VEDLTSALESSLSSERCCHTSRRCLQSSRPSKGRLPEYVLSSLRRPEYGLARYRVRWDTGASSVAHQRRTIRNEPFVLPVMHERHFAELKAL